MKKINIILFLLISSCAYPDIDSIPDFNNLSLTSEESIDLCNLINTDNEDGSDCLKKIKSK